MIPGDAHRQTLPIRFPMDPVQNATEAQERPSVDEDGSQDHFRINGRAVGIISACSSISTMCVQGPESCSDQHRRKPMVTNNEYRRNQAALKYSQCVCPCMLCCAPRHFQMVSFAQRRERQYIDHARQSFPTLTAYFELNRPIPVLVATYATTVRRSTGSFTSTNCLSISLSKNVDGKRGYD
ncbi:hypothetical protein OSTOST_23898 [Ostertagia ostertagi]